MTVLPAAVPVARNSTFVTPTLSAAVAASAAAVPPMIAPFAAGVVTLVVGAVRSTVIVIGALVVELPAASKATLCNVYVPVATASEFHAAIHPNAVLTPVPINAFDKDPPVARNSTRVTATLSPAIASRMTAFPRTDAPLAGITSAFVGAVLSILIVTPTLRPTFPAASRATLWSVYVPSGTAVVFRYPSQP